MTRILDPFTSASFVAGLTWGVVGLAAGWLVSIGWRRWAKGSPPLAGAVVAVATLLAMPDARDTPEALLQGVALLALAGLVFPLARRFPLLPGLLAVPGAWLVVEQTGAPVEGWRSVLLLSMIVIGAPLAASFDAKHAKRGFGPILLAVTVFGAFTTLPDTEEVLVMLGVVLPLALLAWPKVMASLGAWGAYPAVGVLAWVIAWGGRGRETAIIGAVACLGLFVVEPTVRLVGSATLLDRVPRGPAGAVLVGLAQAGVVFVAARVAGLQSNPLAAATILVVAFSLVWAVLGVFSSRRPSGRHTR